MRYLKDKYIRGFLLIGMGVFTIIMDFTHERPLSSKELFDLSGNISMYSFEENTGIRRNGYEYYIYLEGYSTKFQIKADYLHFFDKNHFILSFKSGSPTHLSIPKYQENLIGTEEKVFLTSLSINGFEYLSKTEVIKRETKLSSSYSSYILGGVSIALGILVLFFFDIFRSD